MGSLRTVHVEDHFMAVVEYEDVLKGLPKSSINDRATLYLDLESYLQCPSQGSHSTKEWTAAEILKAMVDNGKVPRKD